MLTQREAHHLREESARSTKVKKRNTEMDVSLRNATFSFCGRTERFLKSLSDALDGTILRATELGTADSGHNAEENRV